MSGRCRRKHPGRSHLGAPGLPKDRVCVWLIIVDVPANRSLTPTTGGGVAGLDYGRPAYPQDGDAAFRAGPHPSRRSGTDAAGHQRERAGQQALTRSEEELDVDTKQVPRGQASVRKQVVTEQQRRTVPVEREELRVQREPIAAGEGDRDAELTADERTIELREEQPVVNKRVVPKERVRIGKEVIRDQEHVSEPVRKEQVEVDQSDGKQ